MAGRDVAPFLGLTPGWYRDLSDPTVARYWDGQFLSEETHPIATPTMPRPDGREAPFSSPASPASPAGAAQLDGREWAADFSGPQSPANPQASSNHMFAGDPTPQWSVVAPPVRRTYGWAKAVSGVFKVVAWLILVGGALSAVESGVQLHRDGSTTTHIVTVVLVVALGSILAAAATAFFAYVMDLLIGIEANTSGQ